MTDNIKLLPAILENLGYHGLSESVKEILAENEKLKEINGKLSDRLSGKCEYMGCYQIGGKK